MLTIILIIHKMELIIHTIVSNTLTMINNYPQNPQITRRIEV